MVDKTIAFVGTGKPPESEDSTGFAMAYRHADAYERLDNCTLTACADVVRENAELFADEYDIADENVFEDYEAMLDAVEPDVVSVCVPPAIHADLVIGCIESGVVDAVHCEKPMADSWGDCREMVETAEERGVQLTVNHQRRFGAPFRKAKELLDAGEIGSLERVEFSAANLYDYGAHSFDLCNYFNDERSAEWVMGQIDYSEENKQFGAHNANQAMVHWEYENGVVGVGATGIGTGAEVVNCHNRLVGSEGVIEVGVGFCGSKDGPTLRIKRGDASSWEPLDCGEASVHGPNFIHDAVEDLVTALDEDREPELGGRNALRATELIFGAWESARVRGRIDFPLTIDDNPLEAMVESGALEPQPSSD